MRQMIRLEDAAKRLNKSRRSIYDYVEKGFLKPVAEKGRPISGGLLFYEDDIEKIEKHWSERISINAAAQQMEVPFPFLRKWLADHQVDLEEESAGSKIRYYVGKKVLDKIKGSILTDYALIRGKKRKPAGMGRELSLYMNGYRLFEKVVWENNQAIIIDLDPLTLLTESGKVTPENFMWRSETCRELPYSAYQGHCIFIFNQTGFFRSLELRTLGKFVYRFGTKNIRIFEQSGSYTVLCRNGVVPQGDFSREELINNLVEGQIWTHAEELIIGDIEKRINIGLKYSWMSIIEKNAADKNLSIQKWISEKIGEFVRENTKH